MSKIIILAPTRPGLGELIYRILNNSLTSNDEIILEELSLYRDFGQEEMLK